jgi:hypothetical protein
MKYTLMNYGYETAVLEINKNGSEGEYVKSMEIIDIQRMPFMTKYVEKSFQAEAIEQWMLHRIIPAHREGLKRYPNDLKDNRLAASLDSYGLSLSDGFWFKPTTDNSTWDDVNFFNNNFSYDFGNYIFGIEKENPCMMSPDITTNGQMPKTWRKRDGENWLLKEGSAPDFEEPYNEKLASEILKKFSKIPFVEYDIVDIKGRVCSKCKNFIKDGEEFVTASEIYHTEIKPEIIPLDEHMKDRCKYFDIPGYKDFFDNMRILDYLIGNTDRHLGNFGFLFNVNTLSFVGPAPIFDNGTSMWDGFPEIPTLTESQIQESFEKTITRIRHPSRIDLSALKDVKPIIYSVYGKSGMDPKRIENIALQFQLKCDVAIRGIELAAELEMENTHHRQHRKEITIT